jgi:hypothetical protein
MKRGFFSSFISTVFSVVAQAGHILFVGGAVSTVYKIII